MLPRTQSIFHVGDEGWEEATKPTAAFGELERSSRGAIERLEGLRILIQHSVRQSNVVIKSCLNPCVPHHLLSLRASSATQLGFLKTCYLCKTELSPHKDVYMYRGDQGFCSEECRGQQILIDERKEMELLSTRERLKAIHHPRLRESGRHKRRILVAA